MSDLTPEELDDARAEEADRQTSHWRAGRSQEKAFELYRTLVRTNWTPPPKVDPDLLATREWCAARWPVLGKEYRAGQYDKRDYVTTFLAGIKHGRGSRPEIVWPDHPNARSAAYISGWIDAVEAIRAQVEGKS